MPPQTAAKAPGLWTTFHESPVAVKAILAGVFINRLGGLLNIFLVLFLTSKGYSDRQAVIALGIYGGGAVVGLLIGGALADRLGARAATVISMAGSGILLASLLYLPTYPLLLAAVALVSLIGQAYRPASSALLSDLTPKDRQVLIFAIYRFGLNLGTTVAPLVGFLLYELNDQQYTLLFWADAAAAMLYAVVALVALPRRVVRRAAPSAAGTPPARASYRQVFRDRRYVCYLVATLLNAIVYVQYLSTLPLDMRSAGVDVLWYSVAVALNGFIVIAFELPATKITQRWPRRVTICASFVLVGAGMLVYGLPLGAAVIIAGTLTWTAAEIIGGPVGFSYPALAGPAALRGRYIGSFQFAFGLGTALGPLIGGALFAALGHGVWLALAGGSLLAVVFGLLGVVPSVLPRHARPASWRQVVVRPAAARRKAEVVA